MTTNISEETAAIEAQLDEALGQAAERPAEGATQKPADLRLRTARPYPLGLYDKLMESSVTADEVADIRTKTAARTTPVSYDGVDGVIHSIDAVHALDDVWLSVEQTIGWRRLRQHGVALNEYVDFNQCEPVLRLALSTAATAPEETLPELAVTFNTTLAIIRDARVSLGPVSRSGNKMWPVVGTHDVDIEPMASSRDSGSKPAVITAVRNKTSVFAVAGSLIRGMWRILTKQLDPPTVEQITTMAGGGSKNDTRYFITSRNDKYYVGIVEWVYAGREGNRVKVRYWALNELSPAALMLYAARLGFSTKIKDLVFGVDRFTIAADRSATIGDIKQMHGRVLRATSKLTD